MRKIHLLYVGLLSVLISCKDGDQKSHGAIVLGDSTTIVTETSPEYLTDYVADIHVQSRDTATEKPVDTVIVAKTQPIDTPRKAVEPETSPGGKGLTIDFAEVVVTIPDIATKSFKNQNVKTLNGVSYQLTSGTLQGNKLILKGGATIQKVSQRYITTLVVARTGEKLELANMDETTSWKGLSGSKGVYPIKGIEPSRLAYKKTSVSAVRAAVSRAAKAERMSRSEIREWENSVRNLKSVTQDPVNVELQSVMWRIEGKDAKGKNFRKEIRIDLPI